VSEGNTWDASAFSLHGVYAVGVADPGGAAVIDVDSHFGDRDNDL
jgi:hypothetical protein